MVNLGVLRVNLRGVLTAQGVSRVSFSVLRAGSSYVMYTQIKVEILI
jgi:hypothetical protein